MKLLHFFLFFLSRDGHANDILVTFFIYTKIWTESTYPQHKRGILNKYKIMEPCLEYSLNCIFHHVVYFSISEYCKLLKPMAAILWVLYEINQTYISLCTLMWHLRQIEVWSYDTFSKIQDGSKYHFAYKVVQYSWFQGTTTVKIETKNNIKIRLNLLHFTHLARCPLVTD